MHRLFISLIALGIAAGATVLGVAEYRAFQQNLSSEQALLRPADGQDLTWNHPTSFRARVEQMSLCSRLPQGILANLLSNGTRDRFAQSCLTRADDILQDTPGLSVAHLAKATAEVELDQPAEAAKNLILSQATAPNEGWLALLRLRIALDLAEAGHDAVLGAAATDILVLLHDHQRLASLAAEFDKRDSQRDWMTSVIEQAPGDRQAAFLSAMRKRAR